MKRFSRNCCRIRANVAALKRSATILARNPTFARRKPQCMRLFENTLLRNYLTFFIDFINLPHLQQGRSGAFVLVFQIQLKKMS